MVDHPPDDLEPVGDALERLDELPPGGLDALLELLELGLLRRECGRERERVMSLSEASERASEQPWDPRESWIWMDGLRVA